MQKLPSGEWWTSLDSEIISRGTDLKSLSTGHAELVAIFPAPSSSSLPPEPRTLKHYTSSRTPSGTSTPVPPKHRYVSRGSFLDYGPYSSFAPTFDQGGREIGRAVYGEVLWRERGNRLRLKVLKKKQLMEGNLPDVIMEESGSTEQGSSSEDWHETLKTFLSVSSLKSALDDLEVQDSVQELLERNAKALARLEELQLRRYGDPSGFKSVEVGSEEWETGSYSLVTPIARMLTLVLSSCHPRFSRLVDFVTPKIIHQRIPHTAPFSNSSNLPHPSIGPFTWLSWDTSADPRLSDHSLTGRQHNSLEIRRLGRDRSGSQFHTKSIRSPHQGPNDEHNSNSHTNPRSSPHSDCYHAHNGVVYVFRSRLPKHRSVCVHIWHLHAHSGLVLPELWNDGHRLLVLVRRSLWAGGNSWEGDAYSHHHGSSSAGVSASGRNVSAATP